MFRVLIFITSLLFAHGAVHAGVVLDGGCYSGCTLVDNAHLSCTNSTCEGTQRPQAGVDGNQYFFKRSTYTDECKSYNGTAWIPCTKKRYDGAAWIATDPTWSMAMLEPIYILMLDVLPGRPTYSEGNFDKTNVLADIDTTATVVCDSAVVTRIYQNFTDGAVNAYPVQLQCLQASTWSGDRTFFIHPAHAKAFIATFMISTDPARSLALELTAYDEFSFVTSVSIQ